jgi:hypothetical protein
MWVISQTFKEPGSPRTPHHQHLPLAGTPSFDWVVYPVPERTGRLLTGTY